MAQLVQCLSSKCKALSSNILSFKKEILLPWCHDNKKKERNSSLSKKLITK
jgi:hypothetical protein